MRQPYPSTVKHSPEEPSQTAIQHDKPYARRRRSRNRLLHPQARPAESCPRAYRPSLSFLFHRPPPIHRQPSLPTKPSPQTPDPSDRRACAGTPRSMEDGHPIPPLGRRARALSEIHPRPPDLEAAESNTSPANAPRAA